MNDKDKERFRYHVEDAGFRNKGDAGQVTGETHDHPDHSSHSTRLVRPKETPLDDDVALRVPVRFQEGTLEDTLQVMEDPENRADLIRMEIISGVEPVDYALVEEAVMYFGKTNRPTALKIVAALEDEDAKGLYLKLSGLFRELNRWGLAGDCAKAAGDSAKAGELYLLESKRQERHLNLDCAAQFAYEAGSLSKAMILYGNHLAEISQPITDSISDAEEAMSVREYGKAIGLLEFAGDQARANMMRIGHQKRYFKFNCERMSKPTNVLEFIDSMELVREFAGTAKDLYRKTENLVHRHLSNDESSREVLGRLNQKIFDMYGEEKELIESDKE